MYKNIFKDIGRICILYIYLAVSACKECEISHRYFSNTFRKSFTASSHLIDFSLRGSRAICVAIEHHQWEQVKNTGNH